MVCVIILQSDIYLTGALASEGVVEGAVEEAGVRMVLFGATPCLAHLILCLCPVIGGKVKYDRASGQLLLIIC